MALSDIVQVTQTALSGIPIQSYWLRRLELSGDTVPDEYLVYSVSEWDPEAGADGAGLIYSSAVTLRYFVRESWIGDAANYSGMRARMSAIRSAMETAGFGVTSGWQDAGDIDGIGFTAFILRAEFVEIQNSE